MKTIEESFERSRGLFNITVTPFDEAGEIDFKALEDNIERVIALGYDGLLIGGTYGEFAAMSLDERASLFKAVMQVVGDRVLVLLCAAGQDVRQVRDLTVLASELGGLPMVTPPYVTEVKDEHIINFFSEIVPLSKTGVMIYNAPGIGITLSPTLIERLCDVPGVVALKQGDLGLAVIDQLVSRLAGRIRLLVASDLVMPAPLAMGFDGLSSTNSCALPELIYAIYHAAIEGDIRMAARLHRSWYPLRECARRYGQPQTTKAVMRLRGYDGGTVRAPLTGLTAPQLAELTQAFERMRLDPISGIPKA
ncbi:dihydrodipicolinate synthase family protein [Alcaligenaceae bacterium CGII-47]|nr:dihydrodipicolinate synthase family protein [Alcaligenaceae bacterium CGII-47]